MISAGAETLALRIYRLHLRVTTQPCDCVVCQAPPDLDEQQRHPGSINDENISDRDAESLITSLLRQTRDKRQELKQRISHLGNLLIRRWTDMSTDDRAKLLKEAVPDLADEKWNSIRHGYKPKEEAFCGRDTTERRQLLLPWLSIDALKQSPDVLFALVHYRTSHQPQDWAAFDSRQLDNGWTKGWFDADVSSKCVVFHGEDYGAVVDWKQEEVERADTIGFPRASLVFEAQEFLMTALCTIVDRILDPVDESLPPQATKWSELTEHAVFCHTDELEAWSPYRHEAFSAPPRFDIAQLWGLATARRESSGDHLRHLQCDPDYMRNRLDNICSVRADNTVRRDDLGEMVFQSISNEVLHHHYWRWIEMECRHVETARNECVDDIRPGFPLPARYEEAIRALEMLLFAQVLGRIKSLQIHFLFSTGFQKHWEPQLTNLHGHRVSRWRLTKSDTQEAMDSDPLDWVLCQLASLPKDRITLDHAALFDFLETHLLENPSEKTRVDSIHYQAISDLATANEMLSLVRSHRPRYTKEHISETMVREMHREPWKLQNYTPTPIQLHLIRKTGLALVDRFYNIPLPEGPKNMKWLRTWRNLNDALEKFWTYLRGLLKIGYLKPFSKEEQAGPLEIVSAHQTKEYQDSKRAEEELILAEINRLRKAKKESASMKKKNGKKKKGAKKKKTTKNKTKTKESSVLPETELTHHAQTFDDTFQDTMAVPNAVDESDEPQPISDSDNDAAIEPEETLEEEPPFPDNEAKANVIPTFEERKTAPAQSSASDEPDTQKVFVNKNSLNVFHSMFRDKHEPANNNISWTNFVRAMVDAGFTAKNVNGSMVSFETSFGKGGRIIFHRPHPESKIDHVILQSMGKNMAKRFDWDRECFALRNDH